MPGSLPTAHPPHTLGLALGTLLLPHGAQTRRARGSTELPGKHLRRLSGSTLPTQSAHLPFVQGQMRTDLPSSSLTYTASHLTLSQPLRKAPRRGRMRLVADATEGNGPA